MKPQHPRPLRRVVFSSTQQQEEDNRRYWLSLTPEERIELVTQMMKRSLPKGSPAAPPTRIYIDPLPDVFS
jgi:hypothetical protein